jgi:hypothetical protein
MNRLLWERSLSGELRRNQHRAEAEIGIDEGSLETAKSASAFPAILRDG